MKDSISSIVTLVELNEEVFSVMAKLSNSRLQEPRRKIIAPKEKKRQLCFMVMII